MRKTRMSLFQKVRAAVGSLRMAVTLLVAIALVLAWGTFYEARFGTAAVQRFVYHSWWFQALLAFLGLNLAVAALERYPWKRQHIPFVLAHIGIILILVGGILGARLGVEGQLIISEGNTEQFIQMPHMVLVVHPLNPGEVFVFPANFESKVWVHEPKETFQIPIQQRGIQLTVDRYFPNAQIEEGVTGDGSQENPGLHLVLSRGERQDDVWLFSRDPQRFGARSAEAHVLFLEAQTQEEFSQLVAPARAAPKSRGVVTIEFPDLKIRRQIPVPSVFGKPIAINGTPYRITFKDYFTDLAIAQQGVVNRSDQPNNPAVAFTLSGPEGTQPFLAFALHPEFSEIHGRRSVIHAHVTYAHPVNAGLPPGAVCVVQKPSRELVVVLTGENGQRKTENFQINKRYRHPWVDLEFWADAFYPKAQVVQKFSDRDDEVRQEALHVLVRDEHNRAQTWLVRSTPASVLLGQKEIVLEYRKAMWKLPVTIKLIDFRKTEYPGTQMAASFESDVEMNDPERGVTLKRKITMNNPLKYRGFSFFQSGFLEGPVETTVLSVRKDPGTPLVYTGFLIVIAGVVSLFVFRKPEAS